MTIERHDPEPGIKVVPMYLEGEDAEPEGDPAIVVERTRTPLLGIAALLFAGLTVVALACAITVASGGDFGLGTILGYGAIGLSVLAVIGGVLAVVLGLGRRWGVIATVLGIIADPLVLLIVLRFFGGFESG